MDTRTLSKARRREVLPGWFALDGFILVQGKPPYGRNAASDEELTAAAASQLALVQRAYGSWERLQLANAVDATTVTAAHLEMPWRAVHILSGQYAVSAALVALATLMHPLGVWRCGMDADHTWRVGGTAPIVCRTTGEDVVAMVAPCLRHS